MKKLSNQALLILCQRFGQLKLTFIFALFLLACDSMEEAVPVPTKNVDAVFLSFSANGQTFSSSINTNKNTIRFEVNQNTDISKLTPSFTVPSGYTVYANGKLQQPGVSQLDFSNPVTYELRDPENRATTWVADAEPLSCKILIDASHDGGVWWYPQSSITGFNQNNPHQGQAFANLLRKNGFVVDELGRDKELTEEMFFGYFMVIRAGGFQTYTKKELEVYTKLLERGTKLLFFTDHKMYDPVDELGNHLGLNFQGSANGKISRFASHVITSNLITIDYIAGSVLVNADQNPDIEVLGYLGPNEYADLNFNNQKDENEPVGAPVMGILKYPKSRIFFVGDMNGLQSQPQPFINNLMQWMGKCFDF